MSLVGQILWLAGSRVKGSRKIGNHRVFECDSKPRWNSPRVRQFIGDVELKERLIITSRGVMVSVRLGNDLIFWKEKRAYEFQERYRLSE